MNTPNFNNVPYCIIKNNNIVEFNIEFQKEFNYPTTPFSFKMFDLKSDQNINNKNYTLYDISETDNERFVLFFDKNNTPDLTYNTKIKSNLSPIIFTDEFCYNIKIDNDHIELCKIINDVILDFKKDVKIEDIIFNLFSKTKKHFQYEESLMDDLPIDFSDHKIEHSNLLKILTNLIYNLNVENIVQTLDYLKFWLIDHIMNYDKKLGELTKNY